MVVPAEAVLDSGTMQTVFLARDDATFEPRMVTDGRNRRWKDHPDLGGKEGRDDCGERKLSARLRHAAERADADGRR